MKKRHSHIAFAWLALPLFMLGGYSPLPAQTEFVNFEAYHISQGQNPNMIADLIQDRQGFLWVSTWDGLYRYDGYQFKKYHLDSVPVLQQFPYLSSTGELLEDQDGNIWVANTYARGGSYAKFHVLDSKQGTFFVFDFSIVASPWNFNRTFLQDHLGNIWVRSTDGLRKISKSNHHGKKYAVELFNSTAGDPQSLKDDTISSILPAKNKRLWIATKTGLHYYDYKESRIHRLENINVQAPIAGLCELPSGNIALGTKGNGLIILDKQGNILEHYSALYDPPYDLNDAIVKNMLTDAHGQLWLITTGLKGERFTLQRFDPIQQKFFSHYLPPFEPVGFLARLMDEPFYLFADNDGTVWMNNSNGLYRYHSEEDKFKRIESPESMSWRSGVAFLRERGGVLWIGTAGNGLLKYAPSANQFTVFQHQSKVPKSISSNTVFDILEDHNRRLWVATQDAGADRLTLDADNQITEVVHYSPGAPRQHRIPSDNISGMTEDADGNIWLCTPLGSKGIHLLTGNVIPGRQFPLQLEEKNEIGERGVRFFQTDAAGGFWAITLKHELIYWNRRTNLLKKFPVDPKIPEALISNQISAFSIDSHHDVWVGTRQGLCRYNRALGHFKRYLEGESINDLYRAQNELLWVTIHGGGLVLLDLSAGKILKRYGLKNGFPSNAPKGILPDHAGKLWIGSDRGLIVFDPSTGQSHLFDQSSGLPSEDFYFPRGCIRRNGEFAMPLASGGFILFDPAKVCPDTFAPAVYITDLKLFNETQKPGINTSPLKQTINTCEEITLEYDQNVITLEYAGLNFAYPEANLYAYKMDGVDKDWIEVGNRRFTTYAGLAPGHYVFWVKAANHDGYWGKPVLLRITILPPWWATWWAYGLYLLFAAAALWILYTWRRRRWQLQAQLALEHREAERLKELDTLKTRLYTNITHEFRTPLTVMLGMAEQLQTMVPEAGREKLAAIRRSSSSLLRLVNQMLDLSKLESGAMPVQQIQGDIIPFLRYQLEAFHSLAESKGIRLEFDAEPASLVGNYDPEKVETIVTNLLSNALKFTTAGKVQLRVRHTGQTLLIGVLDTGSGIKAGARPFVFDRFYQAENAANRPAEGTGIGLALTKELVKLLGGEISVQSEPGAGTEFTVRLPFQAISPAPGRDTAGNSAPEKQNLPPRPATAFAPAHRGNIDAATPTDAGDVASKPALLIVEDNADVVLYLQSLLQNTYRIDVAADGRAGLAHALEHVPDIILSDVMMPGMDGFELCQSLKTDIRTSHIPIILLTAKADIASRIEGLQHGADAYLAKPFHKEELFVRLKKLLELRKRLQARYANAGAAFEPPPHPTLEDTFMQQVRGILEAHLDDDAFGIPDLCKALAMSRAQLYRKFQALTDQPVGHYFRDLRLHKAKTLLRDTDLRISEIAFQVGFKDPAHFTRAFEEAFGVSPSGWRKG